MAKITRNLKIGIIYYNLAEFQLYRPYTSKALGKNVKCQFTRFQVVTRPILHKISSFWPQIFQNPENIPTFKVLYGILPGYTWKNGKTHTLNTFRAKLEVILTHFLLILGIFLLTKCIGKGAISVIRGRTQTRISSARSGILTFCKKRVAAN